MLSSRIALSAFLSFVVCGSVVACRVATQQNELYAGDDHVASARLNAPPDDAASADPADEGVEQAPADAATDVIDARDAVAPPCTQQAMYATAPSTTCAADSIIVAGGTVGTGGYYLSRWADGAKWCTSASPRQGTMTIENVGGTLFMRWTLYADGKTTWGTYQLEPNTLTSFMREEVCNWTPQTPATLVSFTATSTDISFFHDDGQERWTRIPKAVPPPTNPSDPIFTQGRQ